MLVLVFASALVPRLFRKRKNHSANAMKAIATTGPATAPAIQALFSAPEDWSEAEVPVAVGVVLEGSLEAGEVTAAGEVLDAVLVSSVVEVLDSVNTDVTVSISIRLR